MEINQASTYIIMAVVGLVIAVLYANIDGSIGMAYLVAFITVYAIAALRFILERRYYRQHGAVTASSQFVILPFFVLLATMICSYHSPVPNILYLSFTLLSQVSQGLIINMVSLSALPALLIYNQLFKRFHSERWIGFAIRRKLYRTRTVPYLLHTLLTATLVITSWQVRIIDVVAYLAVIYWLVYSFSYYLIPAIRQHQQDDIFNVPALPPIRYDPVVEQPATRRRPSTSYNGRQPRVEYSSARTINPGLGSRAHTIQEPTRQKKKKKAQATQARSSRQETQSRQPQPRRQASGTAVEIAEPRELRTIRSASKHVNNVMMPSGRVTADDLKCIYCYDSFEKDGRRVVICPNCKYPGHEEEYLSWIQVSDLCARCARKIPKVATPKLVVDVAEYIDKVVKQVKA